LKKKAGNVKSVEAKQPTSTTKAAEEKTPVRSALSWLYAAPVTPTCTKMSNGQKKKAT